MTASSNLFLVGPMGSGKTAVGKTLARRLRMPFVDTDTEIERRTGVDIPRIFDTEGEVGFRQREREIVAELTATNGVVLSTGGGAVLAAESRAYLRERGTVIYLETSIAQQVARVRRGESTVIERCRRYDCTRDGIDESKGAALCRGRSSDGSNRWASSDGGRR